MFWVFLIVITMGAFLINLGAMSVLLKLIFTVFKVALVAIVFLIGFLVWRWFINRGWRRLYDLRKPFEKACQIYRKQFLSEQNNEIRLFSAG